MSDIVKQIRESFETCIQTTLGEEWAPLENKFDIEKNNFYNADKRFGVIFKTGGTAEGQLLKYITVERVCEVTLTNGYIATLNNDVSLQSSIDVLEDAIDKIANISVNGKLGVPNLVIKTNLLAIEQPDYLSIENLVIMVFNLGVEYRSVFTQC